ncbi:MAG: hypothetical protein JWM11_5640 [Planctomycetaceae bacterium]|nr:hypothetical protein [Planctomycetaceae bacterium]
MTSRHYHILASLVFLAVSGAPALVHGHGGVPHPEQPHVTGPRNWSELWTAWAWEPGVLISMLLTAWLYARGTRRIWREAGAGRGIRFRDLLNFSAGWLALIVALVSPLHPWGNMLFSAHMSQHEILMLVAAPLLVLGRPLVAFLKALPAGWATAVAQCFRNSTWQLIWHSLSHPFSAWLIHGVTLWIWHIPFLFEATLTNEWIHAFQHISFLGSALLFWWALIQGPHYLSGYGLAVLYLFTTALHSGLLGALITFASTVWYPAYAKTTASWGLTPLEDQQLGGLIMWVPACSVYIIAGLAFFTAWLRRSELRARQSESCRAATSSAGALQPRESSASPEVL